MNTRFFRGTLAVLAGALVAFAIVACQMDSSDVLSNNNALNETPAPISQDLGGFDYVFCVVDVSASNSRTNAGSFEELLNTNAEELQTLAAIFDGKVPDVQNGSKVSVLARLAQINILSDSNTDVRNIVNYLASQGLYVQFAHKDFLISQTESFVGKRSVENAGIVSKRTLTYNGQSTIPNNWISDYGTFQQVDTNRTADESQSVWLSFAEGSEDILGEYMQALADAMLLFPGAEVIEGEELVHGNHRRYVC